MANLYNKNIGINYKGILNLDSTINTPLDTTLRSVTDGMGTASVLNLSTTQVNIGGGTALGRLAVRGDGTNPIARFESNSGTFGFIIGSSGNINPISGGESVEGITAGYNGGFMLGGGVGSWRKAGGLHNLLGSGYENGWEFTTTVNRLITGEAFNVKISQTFNGNNIGSALYRPLSINYTINNTSAQTGNATGLFLNATETALNGMTHNLLDLQRGGASQFNVDRLGNTTLAQGSSLIVNAGYGTKIFSSGIHNMTFQGGGGAGAFFEFIGNGGSNLYATFRQGSLDLNTITLIKIGGTTNAFPMIKRNGTAIDFRLADDSNFCNLSANSYFGYGQTLTSGVGSFGTFSPNASAQLDVTSTTKGFLMPRMTYAQMKAISSPATGLQVYNTTDNTPQVFDGTGYQILGTSVVTGTISAGATTLSCDNGNVFNLTLVNGTPTAITLSNARPTSVIINLKQPAGGSATVTWSTTIVWAGGSAPTLTTTANFLDVITLIYDGTTWRGTATLNFAS